MTDVDAVVRLLRGGALAVLPTDTVYGLVCAASSRSAAADLYRLKGRQAIQPTAIVCATVEGLLRAVPELDSGVARIARDLLPSALTLVVPNPARRFAWLCEGRTDAIGVRVPVLPGSTFDIVEAIGAVVATSANLPGRSDPRRLDDVPAAIRDGVAATVDGGALPGTPSTVIDICGPEPVVLRVGAVDPEGVLGRIVALRTQSLPRDDRALTGAE